MGGNNFEADSTPVVSNVGKTSCCSGKSADQCCNTSPEATGLDKTRDSVFASMAGGLVDMAVSGACSGTCSGASTGSEEAMDDLVDNFLAAIRDFLETSETYIGFSSPGPLVLENLANVTVDHFLASMNLLASLEMEDGEAD